MSDSLPVDPPERRVHWVIPLTLFFVSGAAGLIYEMSWMRQIGLVLGQTEYAAALVLATYMGGMALGYALGQRWQFRVAPLRGYALAEFAAAAWVWVVPMLLGVLESSAWRQRIASVASPLHTVLDFAIAAGILFPATVAMAATLPFMTRLATSGRVCGDRWKFAVYAANTMGGLGGILLAMFWLLPDGGVKASSYFASVASVLCGIMALLVSPSSNADQKWPVTGPSLRESKPTVDARLMAVAAISGFVTLALEVLYTRLFSLIYHNSTYTFGAILAVVLSALAASSILADFLSRRFDSQRVLVFCGVASSVAILASVLLFVNWTRFEYFRSGRSFASYLAGVFGLTSAIVAPPILLLGMMLPLTWKASASHGSSVGKLTSINTAFAALGALAAAMLLRPTLGLWGAFWGVAGLAGVVPLLFVQRRVACLIGLLLFVLPGGLTLDVLAEVRLRTGIDSGKEIVRRWESPYGWIDVVHDVRSSRWQVRQNLHYSHGASGTSATRERRQGHLPLLLHPRPAQTLFLGLGTGITASAVPSHALVEQGTIVELIPEVVEAARYLTEFNENVLSAPKVRTVVDDARHFLSTTPDRFDVIVADLYVPWESQTGYLYTAEHFELVCSRLKDGGLFCQWLPLYQLGAREFELIANTFASVFPHSTVWWGQIDSRRPIMALIGTETPLHTTFEELTQRIANVPPLAQQTDPDLASPDVISDLCAGRWEFDPQAARNTDEHPWVEFLAPITQRDSQLLTGRAFRQWYERRLCHLPEFALDPSLQSRDPTAIRGAWIRAALFDEPDSRRLVEPAKPQ